MAVLIAVVALGGCASCQSTVRQTAMPFLAGSPIDGVVSDPGSHRLYLADQGNKGVDVVDISSASMPNFERRIDTAGIPHGLAVAPDAHRLYAALEGGVVAAIDIQPGSPSYLQVVSRIQAGRSTADLLDYSAQRHQLLVSTGTEGRVVALDTAHRGLAAIYVVDAPVEQPRFNSGDGMVYVAAPALDAVLQIDPATAQVTRRYVVKGCHPTGLAINPTLQVALAGCRGSVALFNLRSGAMSVTRAVQGGDLVSYDSQSDRFAVASPHAVKDSAVGLFMGDGEFIGVVSAPPTAHAAAFDSAHGLVYAPGPSGLMSIAPAACTPPPRWLKFAGGLSVFALPLMAVALLLVVYARRKSSARQAEPSFRELQERDLAMERERMRALEDSMFGPQVNPRVRPEP